MDYRIAVGKKFNWTFILPLVLALVFLGISDLKIKNKVIGKKDSVRAFEKIDARYAKGENCHFL